VLNRGYIFHGTRVSGLTWAYRLSGGNLRAVQAIAGHTSPKMAAVPAGRDGLPRRGRRQRLQDDRGRNEDLALFHSPALPRAEPIES